MSNVMEWVKANVWIVVFVLLMIAALVALPIVASGMNEEVRNEVKKRAGNLASLKSLENSDVAPPGETTGSRGIINEDFIKRYQAVAQSLSGDAAGVQKSALEHNRKDRSVFKQDVLPEFPENLREVIPQQFHEAMMAAYAQLLSDVRAGTPPVLDSLREELQLARSQFISQDLKKDPSSNEPLPEDEQKRLTEHLSQVRMSLYADAAGRIGLYLSLDDLYVPQWNPASLPTPADLFAWQWQYWVTEDIVRALNELNKTEQSVIRAPVKHVLSLAVHGLPSGGKSATGQPAAPPRAGGGGASDFGGGEGGAPPDEEGGGGPARGGAPNPKVPVPRNYAYSFTGLTSNSLYDVVYVDLSLVVETARLPQVLDALAKYNFITPASLELSATNPFAAVENGFFYGPAPVSTVTMRLETVWLREWTQEFMPKSVKQELGLPVAQPTGAPGAAGDPST